MNLSVAISGAGITALATARALTCAGHRVKLFERMPTWHPRGAGIALPANATLQLQNLGLLEKVQSKAMEGRQITYCDRHGEQLCCGPFQGLHPEKMPYLALPHCDLHRIMLEGIGDTPLLMGRTVRRFHDDGGKVYLTLDNGEKMSCDLLIAADGIHSSIRKSLFPDCIPGDLGVFCWRFITKKPEGFGFNPVLFLGRDDAFLTYPLPNNTLYCYGHRADDVTTLLSPEDALAQLIEQFQNYCSPVVSILKRLNSRDRLITGRMPVMEAPVWKNSQRVLCLGDAAHGCGPILQQGVGQGLEDAVVLAEELQKASGLDEGLNAFIRRRHERVSWVCMRSNIHLRRLSRDDELARNQHMKQSEPVHTREWRELFQSVP